MWVSGSLIRSSTWRSSSVSAPCISSSICLPSSLRQIAHDARQLLPGVADRLHARLHDAFLQLGGDVGQPLQRRLEFGILVAAHDLEQLVAGQHQLGHHGHQLFERIDGDADRLAGGLVPLSSSAAGRLGGGGIGGAVTDDLRNARSSRRRNSPVARPRERRDPARAPSPLARPAIRSLVAALRLALVAFERFEDRLDAVDGGQDQRDGVVGHRHAVAKLAHQRFGGMRQRFEPRQPEEAAGPLDGVDEAEDVVENLGVVRVLLEAHELDVDHVEAFVGLGQEFPQQVVHGNAFVNGLWARPPLSVGSTASVLAKGLILVADYQSARRSLTVR